jgi:hypothetical protein
MASDLLNSSLTSFFGLRGVFRGKTGSEVLIPVVRFLPPPVGGKFRSQSFFCNIHLVFGVGLLFWAKR